MSKLDIMIQNAKEVMQKAYAPYSHFHVGACIETDKGNFYSGCNVENASYGLTTCAEASAIATMVSCGERHIKEIAVISESEQLVSPCGACRQRINEFSNANTLVHLCGVEGLRKTVTLTELLPISFGPKHLKITT